MRKFSTRYIFITPPWIISGLATDYAWRNRVCEMKLKRSEAKLLEKLLRGERKTNSQSTTYVRFSTCRVAGRNFWTKLSLPKRQEVSLEKKKKKERRMIKKTL